MENTLLRYPIIIFLLTTFALLGCEKQQPKAIKREIVGDKVEGLPFSPGVKVGNMLFVSGHLGYDPATKGLVSDSIEDQTKQTLKRIGNVLQKAGHDYKDVVRATVYLKDLKDFQAMNNVYKTFFPVDPPTRATVEVSGLALGAKIEISVIAVKAD